MYFLDIYNLKCGIVEVADVKLFEATSIRFPIPSHVSSSIANSVIHVPYFTLTPKKRSEQPPVVSRLWGIEHDASILKLGKVPHLPGASVDHRWVQL
jgi:hypothetical protein